MFVWFVVKSSQIQSNASLKHGVIPIFEIVTSINLNKTTLGQIALNYERIQSIEISIYLQNQL